ncbi:hypothetical protein [Actinoplanes sp. NPDC026619]|uniref:hypothetical protein n=1 Tax=Actinoplanes sp. NPDC026619 TaxID=3155798 RepID=UPI0033F9CB40
MTENLIPDCVRRDAVADLGDRPGEVVAEDMRERQVDRDSPRARFTSTALIEAALIRTWICPGPGRGVASAPTV